MPKSFAVGKYFESFISKQVVNGRYNNASEVVRAGLRLLEDSEKLNQVKFAELESDIAEGLADIEQGRVHSSDDVFSELKNKYCNMKGDKRN